MSVNEFVASEMTARLFDIRPAVIFMPNKKVLQVIRIIVALRLVLFIMATLFVFDYNGCTITKMAKNLFRLCKK